ncbi:hypothetical protein pb186bvf_011859 [Paramecium bursaria]
MNINEEQRKKLQELHQIQQRQLEELIRQQQLEQMLLLQDWKAKEEHSKSRIMNESMKSVATYKPYTLSQYKQLQLQPVLKNGGYGLGPTLSIEKWTETRDKMSKMYEFAEKVKYQNRNLKPHQIPKTQPKVTARQRAIEFARKIQRPLLSPKRLSGPMNEYDEFLEYEIRNKQLKEQIERIK